MITRLLAALILTMLVCSVASAQGCGPANPNCIVPDRPNGDSTSSAANTKFVTNAVANPALPQNDIFVGNASNQAAAVAMSADCTIIASGAITCSKTGGVPFGGFSSPQGRCTLTSGTAVMVSDVASATTVFYTPAIGINVPLYNGSTLVMVSTGGEISQTTTDTTKSPAAVVNNSNYDIFVWTDSGTIRATRGPPWTSDTARGSGAGTTELDFTTTPGVPLNKNAITNGPAADRGTYVCTIRSNGTATIDMKFGTSSLGGGKATIGVYNAWNQVRTSAEVSDSTASWNLTSSTPQACDASTNNRIEFVSGLQTQGITVMQIGAAVVPNTIGSFANMGFGLDSTTSFDRKSLLVNQVASTLTYDSTVVRTYKPQIGFHFLSCVEAADGTHAVTFLGNAVNVQAISANFIQ